MINSKNDCGVPSNDWAKAKAKEIFDKMKGFKVSHSHSKKCAKVAVNLMIENVKYQFNLTESKWNQVLEEIEKIELPKNSKKVNK
jgi:hypothetical protein